jgi:3-oxoadipate enol-lactonase
MADEPGEVPPGRWVEVAGGTEPIFVREWPGPPGVPAVLLLHGWVGTGATNWFSVFGALAGRFGVLAMDLRGHGRGLPPTGRFSLEECAEDVVAVLEALEAPPVILAGFSMGGPVAQLTWRGHPERVAGLVFCATSYSFVHGEQARLLGASAIPALAQAAGAVRLPSRLTPSWLPVRLPAFVPTRSREVAAWAAGEMRRHDVRAVVEAAWALSRYDAEAWIGQIDVPTAVVATTKDRAVNVSRQLRMARAIPEATVHFVSDGHLVCGRSILGPAVLAACEDVASRT